MSTSLQSHLSFLRIFVFVRRPYQNSEFCIPQILGFESRAYCFHCLRPFLKTKIVVDTCCCTISSPAGVFWLLSLVLPGVLLGVLGNPEFRALSILALLLGQVGVAVAVWFGFSRSRTSNCVFSSLAQGPLVLVRGWVSGYGCSKRGRK